MVTDLVSALDLVWVGSTWGLEYVSGFESSEVNLPNRSGPAKPRQNTAGRLMPLPLLVGMKGMRFLRMSTVRGNRGKYSSL